MIINILTHFLPYRLRFLQLASVRAINIGLCHRKAGQKEQERWYIYPRMTIHCCCLVLRSNHTKCVYMLVNTNWLDGPLFYPFTIVKYSVFCLTRKSIPIRKMSHYFIGKLAYSNDFYQILNPLFSLTAVAKTTAVPEKTQKKSKRGEKFILKSSYITVV